MELTDDHFSLKWSNFRSSLTEGFHDLLREETMVDVTLAAEGKFLQAHKLVLSVCSPYFKNLFKVNPCKHPIVIMRDVNSHELGYMLEFMYKGEVGVKHEELPSFLRLAETLKVKGLAGGKFTERYGNLGPARVRKKISDCMDTSSESDPEPGVLKQKDMRSLRKRKPRSSKQCVDSKQQNIQLSPVKRAKRRKREEEDECSGKREGEENEMKTLPVREEEEEDDDDNPLVRLIIGNSFAKTSKPEETNESLDNGFQEDEEDEPDDDDDDDDETSLDEDRFSLPPIPPMMFNPDGAEDADQEPQGNPGTEGNVYEDSIASWIAVISMYCMRQDLEHARLTEFSRGS